MKFTFTFIFFIVGLQVFAQWSDTTNKFTDSLHMQVTNAPYNQVNPVILRSYPDSGYFVIWEDNRNDPSNDKTSIYAQKYTKAGVALWAANGVPVSTSTNNQHYHYSSEVDPEYRNRSYAATDSANGFYIAYADDSVNTYVYERACVQHIKNDGSAVFNGPGHILYSSTDGNLNVSPQLVADGSGGFFCSFGESGSIVNTFYTLVVYCFKDVNGTLQTYGGGQVNENAVQVTATSPCGNYTYLNYTAAEIQDYKIFPDGQGGCNIVMAINVNGQGVMLGYNKLFRAKKNATATEHYLDENYSDSASVNTYIKGDVYRLYYLRSDHQRISCGSGSNLYVVAQYRLVQNGFQEVDGGSSLYDLHFPKGVTAGTTGNINASLLAVWERTYSAATGVSNAIVKGYAIKEEVYDSIPYQRASSNDADYPGYNTTEPASLNKLNYFRDTLLPSPSGYYFSLAGGANQIYSSAVQDSGGLVRLQHLAVEAQSADSFAIVYKTTPKTGTIVGSGSYDAPPLVAVNQNGNALFYTKLYSGSTGPARVSPLLSGTQLTWGAMGQFVGTGYFNNNFYDMISPVALIDPLNGTGLIAWTDTRNNGNTGYDIYLRHLDDLNNPDYEPPYLRVKPVPNPYGPPTSSATLYGTSGKFTPISVFDAGYTSEPGTSPAVALSDNYNLGTVTVKVSDNTSGIRSYNGKPYLDRSYTITPQNNPNGAFTVSIRLFFTTAQFNALKTADPSIQTPGDLGVVKQPGTGSGSTYNVVAGEQYIPAQSWAAVDGGYYIQVQVTSFSNFFIFKINGSLPLTWLGVQAQWQNSSEAKVSWQVADQVNIKNYTVEHSTNGTSFTDACGVSATTQTQYYCTVPAAGGNNFYRVMETDIDGKKSYSKVVVLQSQAAPLISLFPNPAKNILNLKGVEPGVLLKITDMEGRTVFLQPAASANPSIDISTFSKGHYLLMLVNNSGVRTLRFSKE